MANSHNNTASIAARINGDMPLYLNKEKRLGDRIEDQATFSEAWAALKESLATQILSEHEFIDVLKSGILQTKTGITFKPLIFEALVRSTCPKDDLRPQQLRYILRAICDLAPSDWISAFGEHFDFVQSGEELSVAGFMQEQLTSSLMEIARKVSVRELLTKGQWQRLCELLKQSPEGMIEGVEEAAPKMPWGNIEDIYFHRPSATAAKSLLSTCLDVIPKLRLHSTESNEYVTEIESLIKCIDNKINPKVEVQRYPKRSVKFEFIQPTARHLEGNNFPLLATLEEIERKSDFPEPNVIERHNNRRGLLGRAVYLLKSFNVPQIFAGLPEKPVPKTFLGLPDKPTQPILSEEFRRNFVRSPQRESVPESERPAWDRAWKMAQQADELFTEFTKTITGWRPAEAFEVPTCLEQYSRRIEALWKHKQQDEANHWPQSSSTSPTEPLDTEAEGYIAALGASLAAWLHSAANNLGAMGAAALTGAAHLTQQHPRATATVALAAIHAAVNEFYVRWYPDSHTHHHVYLPKESDPELRREFKDEVRSVLRPMPDVVQSVRALLEASDSANPLDDPKLVKEVEILIRAPAPSNPDKTIEELVVESASRVSRLRMSQLGVDEEGNLIIEEEDVDANSQRFQVREPAELVIEAMSDEAATQHADRTLQAQVVEKLTSARFVPLPVSTDTSIYKAASLYQEAVNDPKVLAWFESKGFALNTLKITPDSITGMVTRDGQTQVERFSIWDDSGWWQVSAQVLIAMQVLDPAGFGLLYMKENPLLIHSDVIVSFYGEAPPAFDEDAVKFSQRLKTEGWPTYDGTHNDEMLKEAKVLIKEEKARAQLSFELAASVEGLADDAKVELSRIFSRVANDSPLDEKCSQIVGSLNEFLVLPDMTSLCKKVGFDCADRPVRISENRIQVLNLDRLWYDITDLVTSESTLVTPFNDLLQRVKETGNALYSTLSIDLQQIVNFRGFGTPTTAGEVRNIIRWLQTSLPPPMPLGNYGSELLDHSQFPVKLTPADKQKVLSVVNALGGASAMLTALGTDVLPDTSIEFRRSKADGILREILEQDKSGAWGKQLMQTLDWYGAQQSPDPDHSQKLLLTAIKLSVDPTASGKPGDIAGYSVYQPKNLGRSVKEIRTDIEQHLIEQKGISAQVAPLVAHLFLADAAPEFLAQDLSEGIKVGTAGWMTLRLGVAIAESQSPGCSRAMNSGELIDLALLTPTSPEQQMLFKTLSVDIVVTWGVMNGDIPQSENGSYSSGNYTIAASKFMTQRSELSQALEGFKRDLVTREEIALRELNKVFARDIRVPIKDAHVLYGTTVKPIIDAYIDGDLKSPGWYMSGLINDKDFDWKRRNLPDLDDLLTTSVDEHFSAVENSFTCATKSMIAALPLQERQNIELGKIQIFTLREETGKIKEDETPKIRDAFRGRQGVLLRCEHQDQVSYYEVFPGRMMMIKRTDLPDDLPLNGVIKSEKVKVSKGPPVKVAVQRGTELPFDFSAYSAGTEPKAGAKSKKLIIETLGDAIPATALSTEQRAYVFDSYFSSKTATVVAQILNGNFLQGYRDVLFKTAKGQTSSEENREYWEKVKDFLLNLIPFVGCIDDLSSGERIRIINGAFGCYADLMSGMNTLVGGVGKISNVLKSVAPFSTKAFEALKITGTTIGSMINPLDGLPYLLVSSGRSMTTFGKFLTSGAFVLTETGIGKLQTCVDRLRGFFGGFAGGAAAKLPSKTNIARVLGTFNGATVNATMESDRFYALDGSGNPIGPPLESFVELPAASS